MPQHVRRDPVHRSQKPVTLFEDRAMGSTVPKVVEDEKTNWVADHCLQINVERRDRQLQSVGKFGEQLHICWSRCQQNGIRYNHFFVTDLVHTMEFLTTGLQVHSNALQAPYYVDASFAKTSEVEHRMKQVCGSMAYSVSLRNCEHLARYIHSGSWVSYQMLQGSYLGSTFVQYMMDEHMKKSNCLPGELRVEAPRRQLYSSRDYAGFLKYESSPRGLSRADHDAFNVLVVGPSGCGKSKLINLLFNSDVTESKGAAHSVTREMKVLSGQGKIYDSIRKVNIIDTIGLCDSHISARMVLELIKSSLKVNFAYIDQVVVICSGRIEAIHTESITQTLEWLRYKDYRYSFTFVYNKADLLAPSERELGVIHMCQLLQVKRLVFTYPLGNFVAGDVMRHHIEPRPGVVTRAKCVSTGFPEGQESEHVIEEMCKVVDSAFSILDSYEQIRLKSPGVQFSEQQVLHSLLCVEVGLRPGNMIVYVLDTVCCVQYCIWRLGRPKLQHGVLGPQWGRGCPDCSFCIGAWTQINRALSHQMLHQSVSYSWEQLSRTPTQSPNLQTCPRTGSPQSQTESSMTSSPGA